MSRLLVATVATVIAMNFFVAGGLFFTTSGRRKTIPAVGECDSEIDCPARMHCYHEIQKSYITNNDSSIDDDVTLSSACGCSHFFGDKGYAGFWQSATEDDGESVGDSSSYPEEGFCASSSSYKPLLITLTSLLTLRQLHTTSTLFTTIYQLVRIDAFTPNASGMTLCFLCVAGTAEVMLLVVYLVELLGWVEGNKLFDSVRPLVFGSFSVFQLAALLNISIMWATVYEKSKKPSHRRPNTIAKLLRIIFLLIVATFLVMFTTMFTGQATYGALWILLTLVTTTFFYRSFGERLGQLLATSPSTSASTSARDSGSRSAAKQITHTSRSICYINITFSLCLVLYAVFIREPQSGPLAFFFILCTMVCANIHQVKILEYIRFGSRKKLIKGGYPSGASVFGYQSSMISRLRGVSVSINPSSSTMSSTNISGSSLRTSFEGEGYGEGEMEAHVSNGKSYPAQDQGDSGEFMGGGEGGGKGGKYRMSSSKSKSGSRDSVTPAASSCSTPTTPGSQ